MESWDKPFCSLISTIGKFTFGGLKMSLIGRLFVLCPLFGVECPLKEVPFFSLCQFIFSSPPLFLQDPTERELASAGSQAQVRGSG